jgi:hypothetical protein
MKYRASFVESGKQVYTSQELAYHTSQGDVSVFPRRRRREVRVWGSEDSFNDDGPSKYIAEDEVEEKTVQAESESF